MKYEVTVLLRFFAAIILAAIPFNIFGFIFSDLTLYTTFISLKVIGYNVSVSGHILNVNGKSLELISACIATSAYYLLAIIILLTKGLSLKRMLAIFSLGSALIFAANILRIDLLIIVLLSYSQNWFEKLHLFFWNILSTLYVAAIWIFIVYLFKIREIPFYSDFKYLLKILKNKKHPKIKRN